MRRKQKSSWWLGRTSSQLVFVRKPVTPVQVKRAKGEVRIGAAWRAVCACVVGAPRAGAEQCRWWLAVVRAHPFKNRVRCAQKSAQNTICAESSVAKLPLPAARGAAHANAARPWKMRAQQPSQKQARQRRPAFKGVAREIVCSRPRSTRHTSQLRAMTQCVRVASVL